MTARTAPAPVPAECWDHCWACDSTIFPGQPVLPMGRGRWRHADCGATP